MRTLQATPIAVFLLLTALSLARPAPVAAARLATEGKVETAAERSEADQQQVYLNFRDADLLQIINLMSELTGKNFLVDEKVRGKVTIIAPKPVSLDEAYQVFLSILEIQGYAVVPQGPIIKIVPAREVKERPLPTAIDGRLPPPPARDEFITQLIPLEHADANEIRNLLSPMVSRESSLLAYAPTNTLILTDVASNISRLLKIIRALDVPAPRGGAQRRHSEARFCRAAGHLASGGAGGPGASRPHRRHRAAPAAAAASGANAAAGAAGAQDHSRRPHQQLDPYCPAGSDGSR
ncbi:MAG: hypothetical protein KatS3mg131_3713 [Candidatus Tectimicrobiota bacterium]|nr:MAG: hypothetical protein KatS3mg131_3713 [Candidatus Tectomicrobia bacterium]